MTTTGIVTQFDVVKAPRQQALMKKIEVIAIDIAVTHLIISISLQSVLSLALPVL